jgi:hypothetical protein
MIEIVIKSIMFGLLILTTVAYFFIDKQSKHLDIQIRQKLSVLF